MKLLCVLLAVAALAGCGNLAGQDTPDTGCTGGSALIGVQDASLVRLCGCNESAGTIVPPDTLTCTVAAGAYVHFQYIGTQQQHQIVFDASTGLPNGPVNSPGTENSVNGFAVQVNASGTYSFSDGLMPNFLQGNIVVP